MKKFNLQWMPFFLWTGVLLASAGCKPGPAPAGRLLPTQTPPAIIQPTSIYIPPTETSQPLVVPTITLSKTRLFISTPTPTPTRTSFPDWTPLPTLSDGHAEIEFQHWLQGSEDCQFPCWAGISPGKTNWQVAKQILGAVLDVKLLKVDLPCEQGSCNILAWEKRRDAYVRGSIASDQDELIYRLKVLSQEPVPTYRVDKILSQYGPPERVFLQTVHTSVMNPFNVPFYLTLTYPSRNFIIQYLWIATASGENTVGCIQDKMTHLLIDSQMDAQWSDIQLIDYIRGAGDRKFIHPLEEVTGLTIEQFYEEFKSIKGDECIRTPGEYWP